MDETLWDSLVSSSKVSVNVADCSSDWMPVRGGGGGGVRSMVGEF